jgi:type VI secretion system protein ImpE
MSTSNATRGDEAGKLFRNGRLAEAIEAATEAVRQRPSETGLRVLLAEYLLFTGAFERIDTLLVATEAVDPGLALVLAEFRQLLRAAQRRRRLATDGHVPDFLGEPAPEQVALLRATVALRAGDRDGAVAAAAGAEAVRTRPSGTHDGQPFDDFRDADDLTGGNLEVLTTTGRFFWVGAASLVSLTVHRPARPRDLFWRRCTMSVRDGPDGDVYLPALYEAGEPVEDAGLRLGRATRWSETEPVRGQGQRIFLVGDEGVPLDGLGTVEFAT